MKFTGNPIQKLLFVKELRLLSGKGFRNVYALFFVTFLSLLAISVANTSHEFLKSRMLDPYTNWLNVPMLFSEDATENMRDSITAFLSDRENFAEMGIANASRNFATNFRIVSIDGTFDRMLYGETFHSETDSLLLQKILGTTTLYQDQFKQGVILSSASLKKLGYSSSRNKYPTRIAIKMNHYSGNFSFALPLNIIKVVDQLPERDEFVIHPELNFRLRQPTDQTRLLSFSKAQSAFNVLIDANTEKNQDVKQKLNNIDGVKSISSKAFDESESKYQLMILKIELEVEMTLNQRVSFFKNKVESVLGSSNPLFMPLEEEFYFNTYIDPEEQRPHNFVLNFAELNKIRHFSETMFTRFGYRIDLASLESKENFAITSLTTKLLAICLFLFSLAGILIFVGSLLQSHLHGIAQNLGTMKAFGLSSEQLITNYMKISIVLILAVVIVSLIILWLIQLTFADTLFNYMISEGSANLFENGFTPFNAWTFSASILITIGTMIITKLVCNKVLMHPPGDLIYRRK